MQTLTCEQMTRKQMAYYRALIVVFPQNVATSEWKRISYLHYVSCVDLAEF